MHRVPFRIFACLYSDKRIGIQLETLARLEVLRDRSRRLVDELDEMYRLRGIGLPEPYPAPRPRHAQWISTREVLLDVDSMQTYTSVVDVVGNCVLVQHRGETGRKWELAMDGEQDDVLLLKEHGRWNVVERQLSSE